MNEHDNITPFPLVRPDTETKRVLMIVVIAVVALDVAFLAAVVIFVAQFLAR